MTTSIFPRVRIVLIETTHPGNIGATARAMKNMGMERLVLVKPHCFPSARATARASGATSVLDNALVVDSFTAAVADCQIVIGASARSRSLEISCLNAREAAATIAQASATNEIAIVFGREHSGLTNQELLQCHYHLTIPCNPNFSSLNLAAAVQVVCYELFLQTQSQSQIATILDEPLATMDELAGFYNHLEQTLITLDMLNPAAPRLLLARLRRLYQRAQMSKTELNIMRGILTAIQKHIA